MAGENSFKFENANIISQIIACKECTKNNYTLTTPYDQTSHASDTGRLCITCNQFHSQHTHYHFHNK